jgi:hypothetical protein
MNFPASSGAFLASSRLAQNTSDVLCCSFLQVLCFPVYTKHQPAAAFIRLAQP